MGRLRATVAKDGDRNSGLVRTGPLLAQISSIVPSLSVNVEPAQRRGNAVEVNLHATWAAAKLFQRVSFSPYLTMYADK